MESTQIEQLRSMLDTPRLFISDYYSNLRSEIDLAFVKQKAREQQLSETDQVLWKQMISKLEQIESDNLRYFEISSSQKADIEARIEAKRENTNSESLDDELNETKRSLFLNKTVLVFNKPQPTGEELNNDDYDGNYYENDEEDDERETPSKNEENALDSIYLMVINDAYLDETRVKKMITERYSEKTTELTAESVAYEKLNKKIQNLNNRIIEINLDLPNLDSLVLKATAIEKINTYAFRGLKNLILIDLSYNDLNKIEDYTFEGLTSLRNLWLNDNQIDKIGKHAFSSLSNLQWLDLNKNLIKSIDEEIFRDLVSLEILDLENNQILSLKQMIFKGNTKLKNLFMQNNPFINRLVFNYATRSWTADQPKVALNTKKYIDYSKLFGRNLLKNSDAENGFKHWTPTDEKIDLNNSTHTRDIISLIKKSKTDIEELSHFEIETEQNGVARKFSKKEPDEPLFKNFVTTYYLGSKYQVVDLSLEDVDEYFFENFKPKIEVGEYYVARNDCGSTYYLDVYLVSYDFQLITGYSFERTIEQWADLEWQLASHTFDYADSFKTLRYIVFVHAGRDTQFWAGNYGSKMTNGYVRFIQSS